MLHPIILLSFILLFCFKSIIGASTDSVTVTWTNNSGTSPLQAILTHLHALQLARTLPLRLGLQNKINIRLCPPKDSDPLINNFTVPRMPAYLANYDHECITSPNVEIKWGWKPKAPKAPEDPQPAPKNPAKGIKGLSVPGFALQLYKLSHRPTDANHQESQAIWALDSESLRIWYTWPILSFLAKSPLSPRKPIPASQLMTQINNMYGSIGERDLKNMPQAVQAALLVLLPEYSAWTGNHRPKSIFNPTWWKTTNAPKTEAEIIKILKKTVDRIRAEHNQQLVIIHHQPTPSNMQIVRKLADMYGEKHLISSTRVLPKTATTLQTLQFIQKAAAVVADSRDPLGQLALLSLAQTPNQVDLLQESLPYTTWELIYFILAVAWVATIFGLRAFYTRKYYQVPLHEHIKRFGLFTVLAFAPIIATSPCQWPEFASSSIFMLYESGLQVIFYLVLAFYTTALTATASVLAVKYYRKSKLAQSSSSNDTSEPLLPITQ